MHLCEISYFRFALSPIVRPNPRQIWFHIPPNAVLSLIPSQFGSRVFFIDPGQKTFGSKGLLLFQEKVREPAPQQPSQEGLSTRALTFNSAPEWPGTNQ